MGPRTSNNLRDPIVCILHPGFPFRLKFHFRPIKSKIYITSHQSPRESNSDQYISDRRRGQPCNDDILVFDKVEVLGLDNSEHR